VFHAPLIASAPDHLVAGVEEGDGAAARIEHHPRRDHEWPDLLESSIGPGERGGALQLENDVRPHRSPDHLVITAAERGQELGEDGLAL